MDRQEFYAEQQYRREHHESYNRERELIIGPLHAEAFDADKGAVDMAQSCIKTSILVNAGGIIAIQTAAALFDLIKSGNAWAVILTALLFGCGVFSAWIANAFGFHALAYRTDCLHDRARETGFALLKRHFPTDPQVQRWTEDEQKFKRSADRRFRAFNTLRSLGVVCVWISIVLFMIGAGKGVCSVTASLAKDEPAHLSFPCHWL